MLKQIIGQNPEQQGAAPSQGAAAGANQPSYQPPANQTSNRSGMSKNILSSDVEIKGSLKFSNDLIIDGRIEGEVSSDGSLTVGENALMQGEIKTKAVTIFGKVKGNITVVDRCELKSNAVLEGDISAGTLAIEEGATFMGQSSVGKQQASSGSSSSSQPSSSQPSSSSSGPRNSPGSGSQGSKGGGSGSQGGS